MVAVSSLVIVPVAEPAVLETAALVAPVSSITTVSSSSSNRSASTVTSRFPLVRPATIVVLDLKFELKSRRFDVPPVAVPPLPSPWLTVTSLPLAVLRLRTNRICVDPVSPSVTVTGAIETVTRSSSSEIVPLPYCTVELPRLAPTGLLSATHTVSSCSSRSSPVTVTSNDSLVSLGVKVSTPPAAV